FRRSEMRMAETYLGQIPDNTITFFDKGFWGADLLLSEVGGGANRHWLTPAPKNMVMEEVERYGEHDRLDRMKVSPQ
ncbi:IS4 family transposase, partial [Pseudomonas syringae pv. tagetis]